MTNTYPHHPEMIPRASARMTIDRLNAENVTLRKQLARAMEQLDRERETVLSLQQNNVECDDELSKMGLGSPWN